MRRTALIFFMIAGCASTQEVLSGPATQTVHAASSADDVAFCIANKNHANTLKRSDGSTVVLVKNDVGAVGFAFTIWPEGTGSRVEYRKKFGPFGGVWKQCVGLKGEG